MPAHTDFSLKTRLAIFVSRPGDRPTAGTAHRIPAPERRAVPYRPQAPVPPAADGAVTAGAAPDGGKRRSGRFPQPALLPLRSPEAPPKIRQTGHRNKRQSDHTPYRPTRRRRRYGPPAGRQDGFRRICKNRPPGGWPAESRSRSAACSSKTACRRQDGPTPQRTGRNRRDAADDTKKRQMPEAFDVLFGGKPTRLRQAVQSFLWRHPV